MKNKLWFLQIPVVILFACAFYIDEMGVQGKLDHKFLRERVRPELQRVSGFFTDLKFKIRGPQKPRNKIVIVEVDSPSLEIYGRWPWHRNITAAVLDRIFSYGAKVVGLDMVFSEPDQRVPDELRGLLANTPYQKYLDQFETDKRLEEVIAKYRDRLVLGWTTDQYCQPLYQAEENCFVAHPEVVSTHPAGFEKFSYGRMEGGPFVPMQSPLMSVMYFIPNVPEYNAAAAHSGYFNSWPDSDSLVRRMTLLMMANGKAYPGLAIEMARVGMGEELKVVFDENHKVRELGFANSGRKIPVSPVGTMEINFRGPGHSFPYVSARDLLSESDRLEGDAIYNTFVNAPKAEVFKDAYVLFGISAVGVFDMRAFPFDSNVPGVEGHATILDNLLSGDSLVNTAMSRGTVWILILMIVGALAMAYWLIKIEAVPGLGLFLISFGALAWMDLNLLFKNGMNWNTSFLYIELAAIFGIMLAAKYVMEERNKKFIRGAFTKYVAPAVVDSILKDPTKLTVGGEKKELTILFSDIRGFTSFSEKMDAKALSSLLNEYLGVMTKIVFAHEGTLDKYIGDAIMAFWGAPLDQPKHAANALKASVAMMKALGEQRSVIKAKYGVQIDIGIGINSGMVSVGNMGSETNFAYTVIGDHVNLASRLEGLTKAYGVTILTTRFTLDDVVAGGEPIPPHRVLDHVKVKGKKNAVELIQVFDREMDDEGLRIFEEGRKLYAAQKWDEGIAAFKAANARLAASADKMDGPCAVYLERCEDFKKAPPEPNWDGSWEMHSK